MTKSHSKALFMDVRNMVVPAVLLVALFFAFGMQSTLSANTAVEMKKSSEVGFTSVSPRGLSGGEIIPASCESGVWDSTWDWAHPDGNNSGICSVLTVDNVTVSSPTVIVNGTTQYTITETASDSYGGLDIGTEHVLINLQGANAGQHRGYLAWVADQDYVKWQTSNGWKSPPIGCSGGGFGGIYHFAYGYGSEYINLVSCSTAVSGTTRTASFVVSFNTNFTSPVTGNTLSGWVKDYNGQGSGALRPFNTFSIAVPPPENGVCAATHNDCTVGRLAVSGLTCLENDNCAGTVLSCNYSAPDGSGTLANSLSKPVSFGSWSNSQCSTAGTGWHQGGISSCSTGQGSTNAKCTSVVVDPPGQPAETSTSWTWSCVGSYGGSTASCSEAKNACYPSSNPANYGAFCPSVANACNQKQSNGTIQCDGSCSSTPPSDASCPTTTCQDPAANNIGGALPCTFDAGSCTWPQMTGRSFSCTTAGGYPQDVDVSAYVDESGLPWMRLVGHCYYFAGYVAFDTGYKQGTSITGSGTCPVGFHWTVAGNAQLTLNGANIMSAHSTYGGGYPGSCSVPAPSTCSPAPAAPSTASASTPTWTEYCTGGSDPFGHSWQIWRYDNSEPPNYEFVKTDLATCGPLAKLDGSCSASHWNCITGTSANNAGTGPWTWSCKGSNGGIDVACSQSGGGTGTGTGTGTSGTGTTGTGSCVVRGGIALKQCSGSAPGSSLVSYNNCGAVVGSQSCEYGCSAGACNAPSPIGFTPFTANNPKGTSSTFTATGNLQVSPVLVKRDESTWLYWNVDNASSCSVTSSATGVNADAWPNASWPNAFFSGNSGQKSKPIQGHTVFTLHCTPLPPLEGDPPLNSVTETRTVDIAPIFQEF